MEIPEELKKVVTEISCLDGKPILVGGAVRDLILKRPIKDWDIEVFGLSRQRLISTLAKFGKVVAVGKSFGVLKLTMEQVDFDFSLPRSAGEAEGEPGKSDVVTVQSFEQSAKYRDFTMNAIGLDLVSGRLQDPFKGIADLQNRTLRVVHPGTFSLDPLRVLRGVQFAARFDLSVPEETLAIFENLLDAILKLPKERIFEELKKLLLKAPAPSVGLRLANRIKLVDVLFPELAALKNINQDPVWHPEGDVWNHTLQVVDNAALLRQNRPFEDLSLMLAALCHDFGKPLTTTNRNGRWISYGHDVAGETPTRRFLKRLTDDIDLTEMVVSLVTAHMKPMQLQQASKVSNGALRRLSLKTDIPLLAALTRADHTEQDYGNSPVDVVCPGDWLLQRWHSLALDREESIKPLLTGRHLIELGLTPGPIFGKILTEAYNLQLDDKIASLTDAQSWLKRKLGNGLK